MVEEVAWGRVWHSDRPCKLGFPLRRAAYSNSRHKAVRCKHRSVSLNTAFVCLALVHVCVCPAVSKQDDCEVGAGGARKACKNCSCGRAEAEAKGEKVQLTKEMLDNPQSSCGNVSTQAMCSSAGGGGAWIAAQLQLSVCWAVLVHVGG